MNIYRYNELCMYMHVRPDFNTIICAISYMYLLWYIVKASSEVNEPSTHDTLSLTKQFSGGNVLILYIHELSTCTV